MKNSKGIVIKPGQVWRYQEYEHTVVAIHEGEVVTNCPDSSSPYGTIDLDDDCTLAKSHDGADLEAARADGWEVWADGMEKPDLERIEIWELYSVEKEWINDKHGPQWMSGIAYRYKLKEETPKYKLFEIEWPSFGGAQTVGGKVAMFIGSLAEGYRIFGFTDRPEWTAGFTSGHTTIDSVYQTEPCDHTGNRKYAIGRLESE